jgi:excisionase family DNA binding protein
MLIAATGASSFTYNDNTQVAYLMLENRWLTIEQAMEVMGVTDSYIRSLLRAEKISGQKISGKCWLVDAKSAREFAKVSPGTGRPRTTGEQTQSKKTSQSY